MADEDARGRHLDWRRVYRISRSAKPGFPDEVRGGGPFAILGDPVRPARPARGSNACFMLHLFYSNRHETLADALLEDLAAFPARNGPWAPQQVIVPSAALR
ncbi:exodeoxyribonuclease V subunit gamma, partial [Burkholderia sp. LMG 13014]|uniref:exodeoxyribonuclease V subunit gamma n=1 Tax=Burkholderia sp. LMG 13014 TaxID=2709306 RepID=UPI0019666828